MNGEIPAGANAFSPFIMMAVVLVVFYFFLIRPQKKKEKKLQQMIAALKVGDEIATIGGIHGKIARIKDDLFVLESGIGTMKSFISIERGAISRLIKEGKAKADEFEPLPEESDENTAEN